jgi:hypothetical protein
VVEIIKSFEQVAGRLSPTVVAVPGVITVVAGLVIWLGGLGIRRFSLVLAGLILGGVFVLATAIHSPAVAAMSILAAVVVAAVLPRLFTAVLLAKLVAGTLFIVLAWHLLAAANVRTVSGQQSFSARESLDVTRAYGTDLADNIKRAGQKMDLTRWLVVAAVGSVVFASGLLFRNATGATAFSILGTVLIWTGLGVLLMFKGSRPVERIEQNALAFGLAAVGMVVFGSLEQYLLCRHANRKRQAKRHKEQEQEQAQESKRNWRGE